MGAGRLRRGVGGGWGWWELGGGFFSRRPRHSPWRLNRSPSSRREPGAMEGRVGGCERRSEGGSEKAKVKKQCGGREEKKKVEHRKK